MKNKVRLSENEPKNHKNGIFSKIAQQIWPKIEIWTHTYVWMLYPKRGKRHFRRSRLSLSNGVKNLYYDHPHHIIMNIIIKYDNDPKIMMLRSPWTVTISSSPIQTHQNQTRWVSLKGFYQTPIN